MTLGAITRDPLLVRGRIEYWCYCDSWSYATRDFRKPSPNNGRDFSLLSKKSSCLRHSEHEDDQRRFLKSGTVNPRLNPSEQKKLDLKRIKTSQVTAQFMDTTF